jgi:hypothetical protein
MSQLGESRFLGGLRAEVEVGAWFQTLGHDRRPYQRLRVCRRFGVSHKFGVLSFEHCDSFSNGYFKYD